MKLVLASVTARLLLPLSTPSGARDEKGVEADWRWTFLGSLLLTPSVQYGLDPALASDRKSGWGLALRATLML
jgi:hypothetical protein